MKTHLIIFSAIGIGLYGSNANAQDFNKDYLKCIEFYSRVNVFSMNVVVKMFESKNDEVGEKIGDGKIKKWDNKYYSLYDNQEMIINERGSFIIDNGAKSINVYKPAQDKKVDISSVLSGFNIAQRYDSTKYRGEIADMKKYVAYPSSGTIRKIEVFFNKDQGYLARLVYYYPPSDENNDYGAYKIVIDYDNVNLQPVNPAWFSEQKYLTLIQQDYVLKEQYKSYKLNK